MRQQSGVAMHRCQLRKWEFAGWMAQDVKQALAHSLGVPYAGRESEITKPLPGGEPAFAVGAGQQRVGAEDGGATKLRSSNRMRL
jgi:hypothetical protein